MKKITLLIIIILSCLSISGCWDMLEINNRIFPYSIGVDLNEDSQEEEDKYIITISYPNINAIGKNATQEERVFVVSSEGRTVLDGANEMSTRLPYKFHFKHLRALILGEKLAEDEKAVREVLDGVTRDFITNKKLKLIVTKGTAKELLNYKLNAKRQEVIEGALITMLIQGKYTADYAIESLTDFIEEIEYGGSTLVPKAKIGEEDIKLYGGCIFKDYACIGELSEMENKSVILITGEKRENLIVAPFDNTSISYDVSGTKIKKKLIKKEEDFKIQINMRIEGQLREYILEGDRKTPRDEFILSVEKALEEQIEKDINKTLNKLQKQYKADVLGIGEYISKFHPKVWQEVKEDWSEVFSEIEIEVNVEAKVRRRGLTTIKGTN